MKLIKEHIAKVDLHFLTKSADGQPKTENLETKIEKKPEGMRVEREKGEKRREWEKNQVDTILAIRFRGCSITVAKR